MRIPGEFGVTERVVGAIGIAVITLIIIIAIIVFVQLFSPIIIGIFIIPVIIGAGVLIYARLKMKEA
jgi:hypothetical protein